MTFFPRSMDSVDLQVAIEAEVATIRWDLAEEIAKWLETESAPGSACAHRVRERWGRKVGK